MSDNRGGKMCADAVETGPEKRINEEYLRMEYAIVDIETTGGHASGNNITEIAIRIFDGQSVIESLDTLVRPGRTIPRYITALTGIDNEMVCDSPAFEEVAEKVCELLEGRTFVAHNVNFDYSFLKYHLEEAGYTYAAPKLCTVRMARKIKPGLHSYSLGNLCKALAIPIENRHRAGGDVDATVTLFAKLLEWDTEGVIPAMLRRGSKEQQLPPNLPREEFNALPERPGVYYFRNRKGKVIYVGKAKNIRKRVGQHFTGNNSGPQRQRFMRDIYSIGFELCGTELMAFILEAIEIKRIWPRYNRAMKKYEPKFGLFSYQDRKGYQHLFIGKYNKSLLPIEVFTTRDAGMNKLYDLVRQFGLCGGLCRLGNCETCNLANYQGSSCCVTRELPETYNEKVNRALEFLHADRPCFYIMDKGRNKEEKSCIWVEHGNFYGMGYIDNDLDIHAPEEVKDLLTHYVGNHYIMQLVWSFAEKYPDRVVKING